MEKHDSKSMHSEAEEMAHKTPLIAKYWFGALLGTASGFVAGLLLAPRSGRETRSDLEYTVKNAAEGAQRKFGDIKETISDKVGSAKSSLSRAAHETKNDLQCAYEQVEDTAMDAKEEIEDTIGPARI